jgi:hypothetical protein
MARDEQIDVYGDDEKKRERAERVQRGAKARQDERSDHVEHIVREATESMGDLSFPVSTEEIQAEYGDEPLSLPNETENLADALDRIQQDGEYESVREVREALFHELTGEADDTDAEYNVERELEEVAEAEGDTEKDDRP